MPQPEPQVAPTFNTANNPHRKISCRSRGWGQHHLASSFQHWHVDFVHSNNIWCWWNIDCTWQFGTDWELIGVPQQEPHNICVLSQHMELSWKSSIRLCIWDLLDQIQVPLSLDAHSSLAPLSCVGHLLTAFGIPNSLYFASVIIGTCFGAIWPYNVCNHIWNIWPQILLNFVQFWSLASPVGSYILNVRVTGYLYDEEALKRLEMNGLKLGRT